MFSFCNRICSFRFLTQKSVFLFTVHAIYGSFLLFFYVCFLNAFLFFSSFFVFFFSLFSSFIADAPVCASTHEELLGALKHETLTLKCEVDASPPADSFHWTFNSSGEPTDLSAKLQSSEVCCFYHYATTFFFSTRPFSLSLSLRKLSSEKK